MDLNFDEMIEDLYSESNRKRFYLDMPQYKCDVEDDFVSDCTRLLQAPSFRRLQGKMQLYPGRESDFFRNRLTHSIEVDSIAQIIVSQINNWLKKQGKSYYIDRNVVRFACYAHDLGHPPFGHAGKKALEEIMKENEGFDDNAQTLHILTNLEKGLINSKERLINNRLGLNITYRCLASVIKHIEWEDSVKIKKYYDSEKKIINEVFDNVKLPKKDGCTTIECQIMDIADDISNAIHDLEDSLKGGLFNLMDLFFPSKELRQKIASIIFDGKNGLLEHTKMDDKQKRNKVLEAINTMFDTSIISKLEASNKQYKNDLLEFMSDFYQKLKKTMENGFERNVLIMGLKKSFIQSINEVEEIYIDDKLFLKLKIPDNIRIRILTLIYFNQEYQIQTPKMKIVEEHGKIMIKKIFDKLLHNFSLLPNDYLDIFRSDIDVLLLKNPKIENINSIRDVSDIGVQKKIFRCICDFIAAMTDNYCAEFYGRLFLDNTQSYYKPI